MALSAEELLQLKKDLDTPGVIKDDAFRSWALQQVQAAEDQNLEGYAQAGGTRADSAAPAPGSLGLKGIIGNEAKPDEAEVLAGQLDPRFSFVPQVLAMQPATTHPGGDEAAKADAASGQTGPAVYAYEPPVSVVQKMLVDNPAFARVLRPDAPPSMDEIGALNSTSPLYQDASNYMWRETAKAAAQSGRTVYRYSKLPYLWGDAPPEAMGGAAPPEAQGTLDKLRVNLGGAGKPLIDAKNAFVIGVDDTAALGASRAAQETLSPETTITPEEDGAMGINAGSPQSTKDVNAQAIEQHPVAHGAGQVLGMLAPWGATERIFDGLGKGARFVADAIAKTRLGGLGGSAGRVLGRTALDAAAGGLGAGAVRGGQELVDTAAEAAQTGELPSMDRLKQGGLEALGDSKAGAMWGGAGSLLGQGAHGGAEHIRDSPRFSSERGPGAVRRTEQNLDWRLRRTITGPRLSEETKAIVGQGARAGDQPGDILAERIAPPVRDVALADVKKAKEGALAERRNYQATPEGAAYQPVSHLERMSLEKLRDHHQPQPDGTLRPVDETYRDAQRVFNRHIDSVSFEPTKGAIELSPAEAETFLGPRARYKLLEEDIRAANASAANKGPEPTIERDAYLRTIKDSRARAAADEEIDASIDDIVGDRTPSAAARQKAEQQVLRELVDEASFVEANGSLAKYLEQRGKATVYVKPAAYDARRTDTLVEGLKDPDLIEAAKYDRQQFKKGGERGGYELMRRGQDEKIAQAEKVEKRVAPEGDAFGPIAGLYNSRPGEKQLVDDVRSLADRAGVRSQLDKLRGLQETQAIANRANALGPTGNPRNIFSPTTWLDVGQLHAFPVLKALEGPLGPLGANAGKAALVGSNEPRFSAEPSKRSRYEEARDRRLKELAAKEDEERAKRERRRARRAAGR